MLLLELKRSVPIQFSKPLSAFISNYYKQDPSNYTDELKKLDDLRQECLNVPMSPVGVQTLTRYYGQLCKLDSRFPIDDDNIKISFAWYNFSGKEKKPVACFNIKFEHACILFNMACLNSRLGNMESRSNADGLKRACNYYMSAAGIFQFIADRLSASLNLPPNTDLSQPALGALIKLLLAQAQECFILKGILEKTIKDAMLAKLSYSTGTMYDAAYAAINSPAIVSMFPATSLVILQGKAHYYYALSHYRKSCDSLIQSRYGEEIVRLQDAQAAIGKAKELQKTLPAEINADVVNLTTVINKNLERANKENNMIYNDPIPSRSSIPEIGSAVVAKPTPMPDISAQEDLVGSAIFTRLVPLVIHRSVEDYKAQRSAIVQDLCTKLNTAKEDVNQLLSEMNLPGVLEAAEAPYGLPESVVQKSIELNSLGGVESVTSNFSMVETMQVESSNMIDQASALLDSEEQDDDNMREQFAEKWRRQTSKSLTVNLRDSIKSYQETLTAAKKSDLIVRERFEKYISDINILCSSREELERHVPASKVRNHKPADAELIQRLRSMLAERDTMFDKKNALINYIKSCEESDDIVPTLALEANVDTAKDAIFAKELSKYDHYRSDVQAWMTEQLQFIARLRQAHVAFEESRRQNTTISERETVLQRLDDAYQNYKTLMENFREGIQFYSDFQETLQKLIDNCSDFKMSRKLEHQDLLQSIQAIATGMSISKSEAVLTPNLPGVYSQAQSSDNLAAGKANAPAAEAATSTSPKTQAGGPSQQYQWQSQPSFSDAQATLANATFQYPGSSQPSTAAYHDEPVRFDQGGAYGTAPSQPPAVAVESHQQQASAPAESGALPARANSISPLVEPERQRSIAAGAQLKPQNNTAGPEESSSNQKPSFSETNPESASSKQAFATDSPMPPNPNFDNSAYGNQRKNVMLGEAPPAGYYAGPSAGMVNPYGSGIAPIAGPPSHQPMYAANGAPMSASPAPPMMSPQQPMHAQYYGGPYGPPQPHMQHYTNMPPQPGYAPQPQYGAPAAAGGGMYGQSTSPLPQQQFYGQPQQQQPQWNPSMPVQYAQAVPPSQQPPAGQYGQPHQQSQYMHQGGSAMQYPHGQQPQQGGGYPPQRPPHGGAPQYGSQPPPPNNYNPNYPQYR